MSYNIQKNLHPPHLHHHVNVPNIAQYHLDWQKLNEYLNIGSKKSYTKNVQLFSFRIALNKFNNNLLIWKKWSKYLQMLAMRLQRLLVWHICDMWSQLWREIFKSAGKEIKRENDAAIHALHILGSIFCRNLLVFHNIDSYQQNQPCTQINGIFISGRKDES